MLVRRTGVGRNLLLAVIVLISCGMIPALGQEVSISLKAIGRVYSEDGSKRIGTAFVAGETHNIFLPAHVANAESLKFLPYNSDSSFLIDSKYVLDDFDLAIYKRTAGEQPDSYRLGDFDRVHPRDKIVYLGWESENLLKAATATVTAKGECLHGTEIVDYIEFHGHGVPGYSGGPVFNTHGEVVAMIVQGWDIDPIKTDTKVPVLRAFSVDLLRILETKLETVARQDSTLAEAELRLIDLAGGGE